MTRQEATITGLQVDLDALSSLTVTVLNEQAL